MKTITYHKSHTFVENSTKIECITQLYGIGVYLIVNNNPAEQYTMQPKDIVRLEEHLKEAEKKGNITNLEFGMPITVTKESGLWEEVKIKRTGKLKKKL